MRLTTIPRKVWGVIIAVGTDGIGLALRLL
jgi:hypothetical protein